MKVWMIIPAALIAAAAAAPAAPQGMHGHMSVSGKEETAAATHKGKGVIQKVDPSTGKVTVKHEAIQSLGWPAMTMAFDVKDKSMLKDVKPGQDVDFTFSQEGNRYVIATIQ